MQMGIPPQHFFRKFGFLDLDGLAANRLLELIAPGNQPACPQQQCRQHYLAPHTHPLRVHSVLLCNAPCHGKTERQSCVAKSADDCDCQDFDGVGISAEIEHFADFGPHQRAGQGSAPGYQPCGRIGFVIADNAQGPFLAV